ncbi:Multidrug resistance-associated protein 1 [Mortierella claussenii]|nr:Multidrug resistance-associated protein 1 [Mortierella claussenii]
MLTACAALLTRIIQVAVQSDESGGSPSALFGTATLLAAWIFAVELNALENQDDSRSSTYIFAYYVVCVIGSAISIRTMHELGLGEESQFTSFCVFFGAICAGFIVEAWPRSSSFDRTNATESTTGAVNTKQDAVNGWDKPTAYDQSNLFSRLCFTFLDPVISKGYRRPLVDEDIGNMMPRQIRTIHSYGLVSRIWSHRLQKHSLTKNISTSSTTPTITPKMPSLFWSILKAGGWSWIPVILFAFTASIMEFLQPVLLDQILGFIKSYSTDQPQPTAFGIILSVGLFALALGTTIANGQFLQTSTNLGIELKSGLISMIYRKSLRLSPGARRGTTVGEITNHMSVDAERIGAALRLLPMILTIPFEVAIATWLLYDQMGPSALTGLGVVVLLVPAQAMIANVLNSAKDKKLEAMDGRIRMLTAVLSGIKAVKLYAWEQSFKAKLNIYREQELKYLKRIGVAVAFMMIMFSSLPSLMALLSFVVYSLVGGPDGTPGVMSAQVVFVSITLFNRLSKPIGRASIIINQLISLTVAVKRVQDFLLQEEIDDSLVEYRESPLLYLPSNSKSDQEKQQQQQLEQRAVAVHVQDGTFSWANPNAPTSLDTTTESKDNKDNAAIPSSSNNINKDVRATLSDINLQIPHGSLTAVVGRVGQGKSSLISAIIGDMYKGKGHVQVTGRVAYVAQEAWIMNCTVKDNILFGQPLDQERYEHILVACSLSQDLEMLPAGDQTEIGERGINLSGGQKQRVSLARAAYQDADVYLLDDPLSAVDAHVDQHLWESLIGPAGLLKNKTRLLITHGIHHLAEVDQIVVIKEGVIAEQGKYEDLMAAKTLFFQLMDEYSLKERTHQERGASKGMERDGTVKEGVATLEEEADVHGKAGVGSGVAEALASDDDNAELIMKEEAAQGGVGWRVYMQYCKAATYFYSLLCILGFLMSQATQMGINIWLQNWASEEGSNGQPSVGKFLSVYGALVALYVFFDMGANLVILALAGIRATRILHSNLLENVMRLPMSFFDTTPVGRIVNRFSSDVDNVDELVPLSISDVYFFLTSVMGTLIIISMSVPIFLAIIPFLTVLYIIFQVLFIRSSRQLKRIHSISKSPLCQHFGETLAGVSTIRAMRVQDRFILENSFKSDKSANANFVYELSIRWLQIRLEFLGALIVFATSLLAVLGRKTLGPETAGLALSYALNATFAITFLVKTYSDLQNNLVSVERIQEYTAKNQEAPATLPTVDAKLPKGWPSEGRIVFKNYSTRYRQGLDLILKHVSFEIRPAERIGVVGRTGAGKSSLTLALFRIVEAANSHWAKASHNGPDSQSPSPATVATIAPTALSAAAELQVAEVTSEMEEEADGGSIEIDGVDISTIGLDQLRQHLAIIPQEPTLFSGTVRENLDPFSHSSDLELWEALERAHLKDHISSLPGGLSSEVTQNGENFSIGQRSLICLARALLRKTKILVLDEATAAVDVETDELIQRTIRQEFQDRTILTIAHRIKTIMDSDRILVLERGCVEEYDTPAALMQRQGLFFNLAKQSGQIPAADRA